MEWIDVKDSLPSHGQPVLCFQTYPPDTLFNLLAMPLCRCFHHIAEYRQCFGGEFICIQNTKLEHVTHWMPLPDSPHQIPCNDGSIHSPR